MLLQGSSIAGVLMATKLKRRMDVAFNNLKGHSHGRYIIRPSNKYKMAWDGFIGLLTFISVLYIPYNISFNTDPNTPILLLEAMIDISFGVDMILNFFTSYVENDRLVRSYKKIALKYLKSWFIVDFLSTFPFDRVIPWSIGLVSSNEGNLWSEERTRF